MASSTRLIVLGSLLAVSIFYYIAFWHFQDPEESARPVQDSLIDNVAVPPIDGVLFWTADLQQSEFVSEIERLYVKYQSKISDGFYVPDYPYIRGTSHLRYQLRGISKNLSWLRRIILVAPNSLKLPEYLNSTHMGLSLVHHSEIMPPEALPCLNWRAVALYVRRIPDLSDSFLIFNEFDFIKSPIRFKTFQDDSFAATSFFTPGTGRLDYSFEVEDVIEAKTRELVTLREKVPKLETRGPILIRGSVWDSMLTRFDNNLAPTRMHVFRSRESINPILLYCLFVIDSSQDQVPAKAVTDFIQDFDANRDEILEGLELKELADKLQLQLFTFKSLFQNDDADVRIELTYVSSNPVIRSRARVKLTDERFRYLITLSITKIVDPNNNSLQSLSSQLVSREAEDFAVYYLGPRTIFTKYYQIRGAIDTWLYDTFRVPSAWELQLDKWYTLSLALALVCLVLVPLLLFCVTKSLLANSQSVHVD